MSQVNRMSGNRKIKTETARQFMDTYILADTDKVKRIHFFFSKSKHLKHQLGFPRGPKSLNFPDGNFQRAKTFRAECVNRFRDKKKRVNRFRDKKTCVNSFCDKKGALIVFATKKSVCKSSLQQNKCAQIIFATKKCA